MRSMVARGAVIALARSEEGAVAVILLGRLLAVSGAPVEGH